MSYAAPPSRERIPDPQLFAAVPASVVVGKGCQERRGLPRLQIDHEDAIDSIVHDQDRIVILFKLSIRGERVNHVKLLLFAGQGVQLDSEKFFARTMVEQVEDAV